MSRASARAWRRANPHRALAYDAKRRARLHDVPCTITGEDVKALLDAGWVCIYCETPVGSYAGLGPRPLSATLDRLIPELGYTPANTVIACHACNCAKAEHTPESLRAWADRLEHIITRLNPREET